MKLDRYFWKALFLYWLIIAGIAGYCAVLILITKLFGDWAIPAFLILMIFGYGFAIANRIANGNRRRG